MKFRLFLICIIIFFPNIVFNAQSQEKVLLNTDRDIYIIGEVLWFNIVCHEDNSNTPTELSKVVYVELLDENSLPIHQVKCCLKDGVAQSFLGLPDTLSSGSYFLKAYTRWMSNFSGNYYGEKIISVINPYKDDQYVVVDLSNKTKEWGKSTLINNDLNIKVSSDSFGARDKVEVVIENKKDYPLSNISVSVVKSCLLLDERRSSPTQYINQDENASDEYLIPELKGELLTGTVVSGQTDEPVENEKMMLSFLSDKPTLHLSKTDSKGNFIFEINRIGLEEMVIQPVSRDTNKLDYRIKISTPFLNKHISQKGSDLKIDSITLKGINNAIINMQISSVYSSFYTNTIVKEVSLPEEVFYGTPDVVTVIDRFINLPTVEDIIREIVPFVTIKKEKGKSTFKIYENSSLYPKEGETLTFIDGVPVYDIDKILALNPEDIQRVEVVNIDYYLEDLNLGRLLFFFTNDLDMADYEFDNRIFRQVHNGYVSNCSYLGLNYDVLGLEKSRIPDFRNLLFFRGIGKLEPNSSQSVFFYTSDEATDYTVVVKALDIDGKNIEVRSNFNSKKSSGI